MPSPVATTTTPNPTLHQFITQIPHLTVITRTKSNLRVP
jgi:hypothetical protein